MKHKIYLNQPVTFLILGWLMVLSGCKKMIKIDPPVDQLTTATVFSSDATAEAAVRGIYTQIMQFNNYIGNGAMTIYPGLSADEISRTAINPNDDPFTNNAISVNNNILFNNIWQKGYFHIYQSNIILENLTASTSLSIPLKKQLIGEVKFIRAFFHFYLVNLFGAVPLVTTSDYRLNANIPRSDTSKVYKQILADLIDAQQVLSENYPSGEKVRPNKWAVTALMSRVYLYTRDWANAEIQASALINSGIYSLNTLNAVFLPNSNEAILQFIPSITQIFNTSEAFSFLPFSPLLKPNFKMSSLLVNGFDSGDQRKTNWVKTNTVAGIRYYYPYKYKIRSGVPGSAKQEYNMVLRLGEQYLIRAEARTLQNNFSGAQADLNTIRNRSGLPNTNATDQSSLLLAIEHERQTELFCEWGHRWFDLKRTRRADAVLGTEKPGWKSTAVLFPIPQGELLTNSSLTQNPGY